MGMSTLDREKGLVVALAGTIPMLVVTGLVTWLFGMDGAYWIQALFLGHAFLGLVAAPLLLGYVGIHFFRTTGNRSFLVFFTGLFAALIALAMIASGLWLVLRGQAETTRWILAVHIHSSVVLLLVGVYHVFAYQRNARNKRKPRKPAFPSAVRVSRRSMAVAFGCQATLIAAIGSLGATWGIAELRLEVPEGYSDVYGGNPFAPSETRTADGGLLAMPAVAGSDECGGCHTDIYRQWRSSAHRKAALDPAYERNVELLAAGKGIEATRYCEGCHAPVALLAGELTPGGLHGGIDDTPANDEGVSCASCHAVTAVRHTKGVGSYEIDAPGQYLFAARDEPLFAWVEGWLRRMRPELHRRNYSTERIAGPEFCATCHAQYMDERMNGWGWVKMQDQYTSWLEGPYSGRRNSDFAHSESRDCNDCHMQHMESKGPSASATGHVRDHRFLGANTFIPAVTGDEEHLRDVRRFLMHDKVRVSIDIRENSKIERSDRHVPEDLRSGIELPDYFYLGQEIAGAILVANVGVGHDFPAGTNDIHEAWVSIRAVDAHGREIHSRGRMSEDGTVDGSAHFYRAVKVDRHGNEVWKHDLFNMVGEIYRNVIPPGKTDVVEFSFRIPYWAVGPLVISTQVNYRKFNKRYGAWVMRDDDYRAPVTVMDEESIILPLANRVSSKPGD